jgi:very-short-patch-repair endonuclease
LGEGWGERSSIPPKSAQVTTWNNLRFRSATEIRIAHALDRAGVLFLHNCKARLGRASNRQNREADFLICHKGRWGILEVDGDAFHPPTRTAEDHERDRLFQSHGILLVQHFAASECWENADGVVRKFLDLLRKVK